MGGGEGLAHRYAGAMMLEPVLGRAFARAFADALSAPNFSDKSKKWLEMVLSCENGVKEFSL